MRAFKLASCMVVIGAVVLSTVAVAPGAARAAIQGESPIPPTAGVPKITVARPAWYAQASGPQQVIVELADAPVAEVYASALQVPEATAARATAAAQAHLVRIKSAQAALAPQLAALGAQELYRAQRVYNGIAVTVDAAQLAGIEKLPGVKAVHRLVPKQLDNSSSVLLIGAPVAWDSLGGAVKGEGVTIGVIDTGIDYLHADFGGLGGIDPRWYITNDVTVVGDVPGYPGAKVVGGWDFAGDAYDGYNTPAPDPDPMDCYGHGTHVAGTAGGYGVTAAGATYAGAYGAGTDFTSFRVGPGVAPLASLYSLRVFGCTGLTALVVEAIEWATDPNGDGDFSDHLDVINMSLGSVFGSAYDADSIASDNASLVGVIVVAAAGNSGDTYYAVDSPSASARALSVASSVDALDMLDGFRVLPPNALAGDHPSSDSANYTRTLPVTGSLVYLGAGNVQRQGCTAFTITNTAVITGNIVLLDWDLPQACGSAMRANNAAAAGARGVILAYALPALDISIAGNALIPATLTPKSIADALKAQLAASNPLTVVLNLAELKGVTPLVDYGQVDTLSSFSSRGPRRGDNGLKPDIAAPGQSIFSALSGSGNRGTSGSGTSMATPHMAGAMALLHQLHPSWTVEELKALAMNTAWHNLRLENSLTSALFGPARIGSGRVDLRDAIQSPAVAYNLGQPGSVNVSFGAVEIVAQTVEVRHVRVVNKSNQPLVYRASYEPVTAISGVNFAVAPARVVLPPYGVARVAITLTANAAAMDKPNRRDPTVAAWQYDDTLPRDWLADASGYLNLAPETSLFVATLDGRNEAPPVAGDAWGMAWFTYTAATRQLSYVINVISLTNTIAGHIHLGYPGVNGPVEAPLTVPNWPTTTTASGTAVLTADQAARLLHGQLYANIHTASHPGGEIRGQILVYELSPLRVAVYAAPRQASRVLAQESILDFGASPTATYHLTGTFGGWPSTPNYPDDILPLVSQFELQYTGRAPASPGGWADKSTIRYAGVASDYLSPTNTLTDTMLSFAIATWGKWSTPSQLEFDIEIDTDGDGTPEYKLYNGYAELSGGDPTDTFLTFLGTYPGYEGPAQDYVNGTSPARLNTNVYNNNVLVLPVRVSDLNLAGTTRISYRVIAWDRDNNYTAPVDVTGWMTYDIAHPGLDVTTGRGVPMLEDLPGGSSTLMIDKPAYMNSSSQGVLLLHHHNTAGFTAQVLRVNLDLHTRYLPIITR